MPIRSSHNKFPDTVPILSSRKAKMAKGLFRLLVHGFAVIGFLLVGYHVGFKMMIIYSPSMAPTLQGEPGKPQDVVLVEKISYWFRKPRRWEVVQFQQTNEYWSVPVIKRIVATPRETISIKDRWIIINDLPVARSKTLNFLNYLPLGNLYGDRTYYCEQGYFVLGDNSMDSNDSRYEGELLEKDIEGRAWFIIWPLSRWGKVGP